jgi:hypothetical protein
MAEWLTHVFIAYALFTVLGWYVDWLDEQWIAVGIVGSVLPDLNRFHLVIADDRLTALTGIPFDWNGLNTVGGVVLLSAIGALLFGTSRRQWRGFVLLFGGSVSHLVVDLPQQYADGLMLTNLYLFPISSWRPPTPGWYVSADRWIVLVAFVIALAVFGLDYYRTKKRSPTGAVDRQ